MVVASLSPTLQPLSALFSQSTNQAQNTAANSASNTKTTSGNVSNLDNNVFNGLISKFKANNTSVQQANAPVANNMSYLAQQLFGGISQNPPVTNSNQSSTNNDNDLTTNVTLNNLNANLAKWEDYLADNDYSFTLQQIEGGQNSGPINVSVTNGAISGASYQNGTPVSADVLSSLPTIEQVFDDIRQTTSANQRADALYNPNRGFPEFVLLSNNEQTSADDVRYIINNVNINA